MVEMKKIRDFTSLIAREFNPERIILFGSYAYGEPSDDSDVDLLVVLPFKGKAVRKRAGRRILSRCAASPRLVATITSSG